MSKYVNELRGLVEVLKMTEDGAHFHGKDLRDLTRNISKTLEAIDELTEERDEADRRAGAAERQLERYRDWERKHKLWLTEAKESLGYTDRMSFDIVWAEARDALLELREELPKKD